jgi:hypothetical protein
VTSLENLGVAHRNNGLVKTSAKSEAAVRK